VACSRKEQMGPSVYSQRASGALNSRIVGPALAAGLGWRSLLSVKALAEEPDYISDYAV
jgi:hypothetical protein